MRRHDKEYKQFLYVALGSLAELETQTLLSAELGFLRKETEEDMRASINEINRMITGLIKCL